MPVGQIWKFDLEQYEQHDFGVKWKISKIQKEYVMLNFLGTTENLRNTRPEQSNYDRGKVAKLAAGNCYSQFPIHKSNESRAALYLTEDRK